MMQAQTEHSPKHALSLVARERASIAGVTQVDSFDEHTVILKTDCGEMSIEGESLHVGTLAIAKGEILITGRICAVCYTDAAPPKRGLRARLFG